jgi:RNA polymerase sigma factor (sigma-70 family)
MRTNEDLAAEYRETKSAEILDELIERNRNLVSKIYASSYGNTVLSKEELTSITMTSICEAIRIHDNRRGGRFSSVLATEARTQINACVNSKKGIVRVPTKMVRRVNKIREKNASCGAEAGISDDQFSNALLAASAMGMLPMDAADDVRYECPHPGEIVDRAAIGVLLDSLCDRHRRVLEMRFGLDGHGERTLSDIAAEFGFSIEAARKNVEKALKLLRDSVCD